MRLKIQFDNPDNNTVQNFILRDDKATKIPGTNSYNDVALVNRIPWTERYYGRKADGTFVKKTFCFENGKIYMGDDALRTLTAVQTGLQLDCNPESTVVQVAGNSRMYFFDGYDVPYYYEGNDTGTWYKSSITYKFVQAVIKDARMWTFERNSSILYYSATSNPEDMSATYGGSVIIGNDKNSFIRRLALIGNYLYIFKNDSIWRLTGNTQATYAVDLVIPYTGLLSQKALCFVNNVIVFVSQQDKQVYEYAGGWNIKPISGKLFNFDGNERFDEFSLDTIACGWDRLNNLFRLSFKAKEADENYNNYEAIFPTDEYGSDGKPKWSETYGARISCYSMWDRQEDMTLVTGRSDLGKLEYHNRGQDWDGEAMECILRTDDISPKEGLNCKWNSLFIKGDSSTSTITVKTYLNSRLTGEGTSSSNSLDDTAEETSLESITYKNTEKFNNWIPLMTGYNVGESMAFEVYDNTLSKEIELDHMVIDITPKSAQKNKLIG